MLEPQPLSHMGPRDLIVVGSGGAASEALRVAEAMNRILQRATRRAGASAAVQGDRPTYFRRPYIRH